MSNDFNVFPSTKNQALALLWLENQDLSDKSPEEVAEMYEDAYRKLNGRNKNAIS